ncbi:hypothetical protein NL676_013879 [Syzygium grande]|nr:hypothetical protein NL676_013879 [Syzygium grande]
MGEAEALAEPPPPPIWARAHSSEHHPRRSRRWRARTSCPSPTRSRLPPPASMRAGARSSEPLPRSAMVARTSAVEQEGADGASHQQELTSNKKEQPHRC